jgi:hypothetical protein
MNEYGRMALDHWQQHLPERYRRIEDPNSFFSTLGDQVATRIADLTLDLAGQDPVGETFMDKLGRLNNASQRAREIVLPEMVLLAPEIDEDEDETDPQRQAAEWVPIREDPNHPWWQRAMTEEHDRKS